MMVVIVVTVVNFSRGFTQMKNFFVFLQFCVHDAPTFTTILVYYAIYLKAKIISEFIGNSY